MLTQDGEREKHPGRRVSPASAPAPQFRELYTEKDRHPALGRLTGRPRRKRGCLRINGALTAAALAWALTGAAGALAAPPAPQTRPAAVEGAPANHARTYRNPILPHVGPADPAVVRYNGKYYLYPTWDCKGYDVFVSEDLVRWERKGKCFADARGGVWAPDVFHDAKGAGGFYLYYTVDNPDGGKLIGVAVSPDPLGPFADQGTLVKNAIDAHVFQDDDGKLYLYYCDLSNGPNRVVVRTMADPRTVSGEPIVLIEPTEDWERRGGPVAEGPWMLKHKGTYYLMYSGSGANTPHYAIGYATAKSPLGPFTRYPGNPIAQRGNGIFGPGHHCVVTGPDGKLWMVYHQKRDDRVNWQRFLAIDPLWFDEEGVIHVRTTRGTTQPGP